MKKHEELQYLELIKNILTDGYLENCRNGNTKSIFGASMRFSLNNGNMPIITTKKTAWKTCLKELLWFINGDTNANKLQEQNVHIWDANSCREFLDNRGLKLYPEGMIGPSYGYQWRYFNSNYNCFTGKPINNEKHLLGVDQLQQVIDLLKNPESRNSRRIIMTAWNPCQLNQMALPPCHILCQFNVHDGNKLSCALYQRSADVFLGQPFNIASYSFLTHLLAKHCDLEAHELVYFAGNCHIYEDHIEASQQLLERTPYDFPTIEIINKKENINDYTVHDFVISNYAHNDAISVKMVA